MEIQALIVDDNDGSAQAIERVLEANRIEFGVSSRIARVQTCRDALARVGDDLGLVFIDCYLPLRAVGETPEQVGWEIARAFRSARGSTVRILAVSSSRETSDVCRMYRAGADLYWHKDDLADLKAAVRCVLRRTPFQSPSVARAETEWQRLDLNSPQLDTPLKPNERARCRQLVELAALDVPRVDLPSRIKVNPVGLDRIDQHLAQLYTILDLKKPGMYEKLRQWAQRIGLPDQVGLPDWFGVERPPEQWKRAQPSR